MASRRGEDQAWDDYCAGRLEGKPPKPADIPSNPNLVYKDEGWIGLGDWLGTGTIAPQMRTYRPFNEARDWARRLPLKSKSEWGRYCAGRLADKPPLPADVPKCPDSFYKDTGWLGWSDWLGNGRKPRSDSPKR